MEIEAIFFDAVGTLIYLPDGVGYHYRLAGEKHGLHLKEEALNGAFRSAWKAMPARPATKCPRPDDDKEWWRELVGRVMVILCEERPACFDAYFEELYARFAGPGVWQVYPEVPGLLAKLCKNFRLGVISNFDKRLHAVLTHLGLADIFETITISSEAGADKPDPHIFQYALASMGMEPARALHVGDDPRHDWEAAERVGMNVFRLERPKNSLSEVVKFLAI